MRDIICRPREVAQRRDNTMRRTVVMHVSSAVFGLLLSRAAAFSDFLPFGTALCAGVPKEYCISALAGVILGSVTTVNGVPGIIYIGAAIVAVALKWVLSIVCENESSLSVISAASGSVFCGICALFSYDFTVDSAVRSAGETLLAVAFAYFISAALPLVSSGRRAAKLSVGELCLALAALSVPMIAVSPYTVFTLSPSRIAAGVLIMFAARCGREISGGIAGILFGTAMCISGENVQFVAGAYAFGGLLGGMFSRTGTPLCIISYIFGVLIMSMGYTSSQAVAPVLIETCMSAALFIICPKKARAMLSDFFSPAPQLNRADGLRRDIVMKMRFASDALTDVSNTVEEVSGRLSKMNMPSIYDVFVQTENTACKSCGLRIHCYETLKSKTYESLLEMTRTMRKKGKLSPDDYPEKWVSRCLEPDAVAKALYDNFSIYESRCEAEMRISQIRSVVSDQMAGLSDMLYDMSEELNASEHYDAAAAQSIDLGLRRLGIMASDVCCKIGANGAMSIDVCVPNADNPTLSKIELMKTASKVCARSFTAPCMVNAGSKILITMSEKAVYELEVGVSQYCCKNERLCGDSYCYFNDGNGKMIMLLSDGMGCGGRAAVDSSMASKLMERLIKAGFGFECSLKLLNSAMMFRSRDESLATVDITAIDLFSGEASFYKAGSPDTIVLKGRKTGRATAKSCPAGIVRNISFDKTAAMLDDGDIVVMTSDGVCDYDGEWLEQMINAYRRADAQTISDALAQAAARRRDDGHEDDITVMVGIVRKSP